jgi:hypothetical protein
MDSGIVAGRLAVRISLNDAWHQHPTRFFACFGWLTNVVFLATSAREMPDRLVASSLMCDALHECRKTYGDRQRR